MTERAVQDRSIAELVQDASEQVQRLVRDEMRLATAEMRDKGRRAGRGAGLTGLAAVVNWRTASRARHSGSLWARVR